ncbi:MAG: hypothetical protein GF408_04910 [Candidatus Omnitrophica bacterium]|nr:hypothetical protein [Candidatus Omnitrophota bacterium]
MSRFATAVNCMDGRVQLPVIEWIKGYCGADYVDMITVPGPDKALAEKGDVRSIYDRVAVSVQKHGSGHIFIAGHYDCAGNPVDEKEHQEQLKRAVEAVRRWGFDAEVKGLWINEEWKVRTI